MNKQSLILSLIAVIVLLACAEPSWTDSEYVDKFNRTCNRNNSPHVKKFCECQLASARASFPNPERFFALGENELKPFNEESFKQCVDWDLLGYEIRKQCEASVGRNQSIDCQCNIDKLKAAIPEAVKYTAMTREAKHKAAMDAAIVCAKEQATKKGQSK